MNKRTILYILAYGRSGSTLLDWLLGSHPSIVSSGEIGRLPVALYDRTTRPRYCGCGEYIDECEVWKEFFSYEEKIYEYKAMTFEKWNSLLLRKIFSHKEGSDVLVDSTGNLKRLKQLVNSPLSSEYNIKVLFLVRDSRAVIYSASVRGYNRGASKPSVIRASISWYIRNKAFERYVRFNKMNMPVKKLTYSELVSSPIEVLQSLHEFIGVEPMSLETDWCKKEHHTFSGNFKLRESPSCDIRSDMAWVDGLSKKQMCVAELITGRLSRKLMAK
ncbi:sulfotransferase [Thiohalomonas denitrificans]|uniref:Sulfotransferase family protein n=1 Tax=Thiohalomonas denitrificans TaxID=415747 RepID=A0A1G5R010_9GAMM|nr:sulfotransferase [Thiohalomonas denitrificans]SCZ67306.1 Sulfotransferase family protein [Thiohalomonas denitrificans]